MTTGLFKIVILLKLNNSYLSWVLLNVLVTFMCVPAYVQDSLGIEITEFVFSTHETFKIQIVDKHMFVPDNILVDM